ncbi:hypothetical protein A3Q56_08620, partial [Intoshia linei]
MGEKLIDYNESFKMILTSRDASLKIETNLCDYLNIVNFSTSKNALESKLLSITIQYEKSHLESKRDELIKSEEKLKIELYSMEIKLLQQLSESDSNILENKTLLESLDKTKINSEKINESLKISIKLKMDIEK